LFLFGLEQLFLAIGMIKLMRLGWKVFLPLSLGWVILVASVLLAIELVTPFKMNLMKNLLKHFESHIGFTKAFSARNKVFFLNDWQDDQALGTIRGGLQFKVVKGSA
jgi:hypothetical protein